jgi:hypothetical protein
MKIEAVLIVLTLLALPLFVSGAKVDRFQDGNAEAVADLSGPGYSAVVNITIPAECYVLNATVNVTGMEANGAYPVGPRVELDGTVLWAFNGTGYGALGRQNGFSDGAMEVKTQFGVGGGTNRTAIRLPKEAFVQNATLDVNVSGPMIGLTELVNFTGAAVNDVFGYSVSEAGDVNNDGYDDVIVGAHRNDSGGHDAGRAYIYYGCQSMNNTPNVTLTGAAANELFGCSVSAAGDVNKDGYDDVIVGARQNNECGDNAGRAYIYLGGQAMDDIPDVTLSDADSFDFFGFSVSTAGDVNNDGYDDVIVGAPSNATGGAFAGIAYIYFGGQAMDSNPDINLSNTAAFDYFGVSVSNAGDVNNDGYDDVIVGADGANNLSGCAYIFFGGPAMDSTADVTIAGMIAHDEFGGSVSSAGDVNRDGYDDVIVGAYFNDSRGSLTGSAYIYLGGQAMDTIPDVTFTGAAIGDTLGISVSSAGDVNDDGYDDVIVGAPGNDSGGIQAGCANIYFGGQAMDNLPDLTLTGADEDDYFGVSVSNAGDVNKDGYDDVIVSADGAMNWTGCTYIYSRWIGTLNPVITVGLRSIWNKTEYFNYTNKTENFSDWLNGYLHSASPSGNNSNGNSFVDVPININAGNQGYIALYNLSVVYQYNATVPDFAGPLNNYISAHKGGKDANGNITVPIVLRSQSDGKLRLSGLNITYDGAPRLVEPTPDVAIDEDTVDNSLLDLYRYFQDDYDPNSALDFSIEGATNSSIVNVGIFSNRYLSADALTGDSNDNWTGVVSLRIRCTDSRGFSVVSNSFDISIRNMNDPPAITSTPPTNAMAGVRYGYDLTASDGDNDALTFSLMYKPEGMNIDPTTWKIDWIPTESQIGNTTVTVKITDGIGGEANQTYIITVKSARPKCVISSPSNGTKVSGRIMIQGTATKADAGLVSVQCRVDCGTWLVAINTTSWTYQVDTTGLKNGAHIFEARAFDGSNYSDPVSVTLVVDNPKPYISSGNGLWWVLPSAILVMAAAAGVLFWRGRRRRTPKE